MSCCSSRRAAWAATPQLRAAPIVVVQPPTAVISSANVLLQYTHEGAVLLRGPFTGRVYELSGFGSVIQADKRDAPALLRTGRFCEAQ